MNSTSREKLSGGRACSCVLMSDVFSAHSMEEVDCTLEGSWASLWEEQMNVGKGGLKPQALLEKSYHTWK